jgi:hypothetical protein
VHSLTIEEKQALQSVCTFAGLAEIALSTLVRMKCQYTEIVQICGPMSTGGFGDFQKNMAWFNRAIEVAVSHGVAVFNQILFQEELMRICGWKEGAPYPMELLVEFYGSVLSAGYITKGLFLPRWETSLGTRWERTFLSERGIAVEEYPPSWVEEFGLIY